MPTFRTRVTTTGLAIAAAAEAASLVVIISEMSIGDGNGNPTDPDGTETALVRERFRAALNRLYQDPVDPTIFYAEMIIPTEVGGFTAREAGLWTADGDLFAIANLPDIYKPTPDDGAFSDTVVRMVFKVSESSVVNLIIDPDVAVATQTWIINNITAGALIPGGLTHQVLRKVSNADGDTEWADPSLAVEVDVFTREETQTLAALQTVVTLAVLSTDGLAVYIDGLRLRNDEFVIDSETEITLDTDYPDGTKITLVQNDQTGMTQILFRFNNLSDVPDKAQARINLGIPLYVSTANINWTQLVGVPVSFPPSAHTHIIANVTGLQTALDGKSPVGHVHTIANVTGLTAALAGKAPVSHAHAIADVAGLIAALAAKVNRIGDTFTGPVSAPSWDTTSARRYKENIEYVGPEVALALLKFARIVEYTLRTGDRKHIGLIGDELIGSPLEFIVIRNEDGEVESVNYPSLFALTTGAVQALTTRGDQLAARVKALEDKR